MLIAPFEAGHGMLRRLAKPCQRRRRQQNEIVAYFGRCPEVLSLDLSV
jgi:hypothetical protein